MRDINRLLWLTVTNEIDIVKGSDFDMSVWSVLDSQRMDVCKVMDMIALALNPPGLVSQPVIAETWQTGDVEQVRFCGMF